MHNPRFKFMAATYLTIEIILQDIGAFSVKIQTVPLYSIQPKILEEQIQKKYAQLQLEMYRPVTPAVKYPLVCITPPLLNSTWRVFHIGVEVYTLLRYSSWYFYPLYWKLITCLAKHGLDKLKQKLHLVNSFLPYLIINSFKSQSSSTTKAQAKPISTYCCPLLKKSFN